MAEREAWVVEARPGADAEWLVGVGFALRSLAESHMVKTRRSFGPEADGIECRVVRYVPAPDAGGE